MWKIRIPKDCVEEVELTGEYHVVYAGPPAPAPPFAADQAGRLTAARAAAANAPETKAGAG